MLWCLEHEKNMGLGTIGNLSVAPARSPIAFGDLLGLFLCQNGLTDFSCKVQEAFQRPSVN